MTYVTDSSTSMQSKVLELAKAGYSTKQIANTLDGRLAYQSIRTYVSRVKEKTRVKLQQDKPKTISAVHHRIGMILRRNRLCIHRMMPAEYSQFIRVGNRRTLPLMEIGAYNFTLSELQRISIAVDVPLATLLQDT